MEKGGDVLVPAAPPLCTAAPLVPERQPCQYQPRHHHTPYHLVYRTALLSVQQREHGYADPRRLIALRSMPLRVG